MSLSLMLVLLIPGMVT